MRREQGHVSVSAQPAGGRGFIAHGSTVAITVAACLPTCYRYLLAHVRGQASNADLDQLRAQAALHDARERRRLRPNDARLCGHMMSDEPGRVQHWSDVDVTTQFSNSGCSYVGQRVAFEVVVEIVVCVEVHDHQLSGIVSRLLLGPLLMECLRCQCSWEVRAVVSSHAGRLQLTRLHLKHMRTSKTGKDTE